MRKYILFITLILSFQSISFGQCDCDTISKKMDYTIFKDYLKDCNKQIKEIKETKGVLNKCTKIINETIINKNCKAICITLKVEDSKVATILDLLRNHYLSSQIKQSNFESCKFNLLCVLAKEITKKPDSTRSVVIKKMPMTISKDTTISKSEFTELTTTRTVFGFIDLSPTSYYLSLLIPLLLGLLTAIYFSKKGDKLLNTEKENTQKLINEFSTSDSGGKQELNELKLENQQIRNDLKKKIVENEDLEYKLNLATRTTVQTNTTTQSNIVNQIQVVKLYAQTPYNNIFQRVSANLLQSDTFFEITTDQNKRIGTYRLVNDDETTRYAFQSIDLLKGACNLQGVGSPKNLSQVQQESGTVEFDGQNWKVTKRMTLSW